VGTAHLLCRPSCRAEMPLATVPIPYHCALHCRPEKDRGHKQAVYCTLHIANVIWLLLMVRGFVKKYIYCQLKTSLSSSNFLLRHIACIARSGLVLLTQSTAAQHHTVRVPNKTCIIAIAGEGREACRAPVAALVVDYYIALCLAGDEDFWESFSLA